MKKPDKDKLHNDGVFCILPWMSAYINTDSTTWSCCVNKAMTDHSYLKTLPPTWKNDISIMENSVEDLMNNDYFKKLRLDMLNGVKNKNCSDCYNLEERTGHSYRQDFNQNYDEHFDKVLETNEDGSLDNFEMIYLDFRFSNLCNFKCRSCRPEWSSTWAKEAKSNQNHPYRDWDGYIPRHNLTEEQFIDKFRNTLKTVKRIYFAGGEPLAAKEHYWILNYLIENNNTDLIVEYNTNLSMLKNNKLKLSVVDYWKKFSSVIIRASLDGSGERAEYIRSGTDWKLIEENFKYVKENLPKVNLGISSVFQLTNALHIPDFYQDWIDKGLLDEEGLHNTFLISLTGPEQLSSHILPKNVKFLVREKWNRFIDRNLKEEYVNFKRYINDCLDYMDSEDLYKSKKRQFEKFTWYMDKIRKEDFSKIFPELKDYYEC
jgi:organic radical activating enzyme